MTVKFLPQQFHRAQQVSPVDEERMRQRSEQRPSTEYEKKLEQLCRDYVKRKGTKS